MSVFKFYDEGMDYEKEREEYLNMLRKCRELIEKGEVNKALAGLRVLCQYMSIAQADALGILDEIVEILRTLENGFGDKNESKLE